MFGFRLLCRLLATDIDVLQKLDGGLWLSEEVKGQVENEQGEGLRLPQLTADRLAFLTTNQPTNQPTFDMSASQIKTEK